LNWQERESISRNAKQSLTKPQTVYVKLKKGGSIAMGEKGRGAKGHEKRGQRQ